MAAMHSYFKTLRLPSQVVLGIEFIDLIKNQFCQVRTNLSSNFDAPDQIYCGGIGLPGPILPKPKFP